MAKENLIQLTGSQLSCASNCKFEHQCFGAWLNEEPECNRGINTIQKLLEAKSYRVLIMTQRFFGIRVFDALSDQRPLPVIGTILIENGNLRERSE